MKITDIFNKLTILYKEEELHRKRLVQRKEYAHRTAHLGKEATWNEAAAMLHEDIAFRNHRNEEIINLSEELRKLAAVSPSTEYGLCSDIPWGYFHLKGIGSTTITWKRHVPFRAALYAEYTENNFRFLAETLVSCISRSGHGAVNVTAIDTHSLGFDLRVLRPILKQDAILTQLREVEAYFAALTVRISDFYTLAGSRYSDWKAYKKSLPDDKTPYTILLILNAQELFYQGGTYLRNDFEKILRQGPAAGIMPILLCDSSDGEMRKQNEFQHILERGRAQSINELSGILARLDSKVLPFHWEAASTWDDGTLERAVQAAAVRMNTPIPQVEDLWKTSRMKEKNDASLDIPIGWHLNSGQQAYLQLNDSSAHCFIGGQTGSGKSNLLHVILHSLLAHYNESELHLYLLDFKQGVEMNMYAAAHPCVIRSVATQSDTEFAASLLLHLLEENKHRTELFKAKGTNNIRQYNKLSSSPLPRIVLLVDECQHLFQQESYRDSVGISKLVEHLVRQGRSQGIHLILSTQTLTGMDLNNRALWNNIPARIALSCKATDSASILASGNTVASQIERPGQAVLNLSNGAIEGNMIVRIPKLQPEMAEFRDHLNHVAAEGHKVRVYNGCSPVPFPPDSRFNHLAEGVPSLLLGQIAQYAEEPFLLPLFDQERDCCTAMAVTWGTLNVRQAMRRAIMLSAAAAPQVQRIYYIYAGSLPADLPAHVIPISGRELSSETAADVFAPANINQQKLVYIQAWDCIKSLEIPNSVLRPDTSAPWYQLQEALNNADNFSYTHIIAEVKEPGSTQLRPALRKFKTYIVQGITPTEAATFSCKEPGSSISHVGADEEHYLNAVLITKATEQRFHVFS